MDVRTNIISAFTEDDAARLSDVSLGQIRAWRKNGFFVPSTLNITGVAYGRVYSFRDIAALRVLNALRNQSKCSMSHLREVAEKLSGLGNDKWLETRLYVVNREVVFVPDDSDKPESIIGGQRVISVVLADVFEDLEAAVKKLNVRPADTIGKVSQSRHIKRNAPVIAGTRIAVSTIIEWVEAGYSNEDISNEYPDLTDEDIEAAKAYHEKRAA